MSEARRDGRKQQRATSPRLADLSAEARGALAGLLPVLARVRRRLWLQRSAGRALRAVTLGGLLSASLVVLIRSGTIGSQMDPRVELGAALVAGLAAIWVLAHRVPWFRAARLLDTRAGGFDRASTALDLGARGGDPAWVQVQAEGANRWAGEVDVAGALPWRRPAGVPELVIAGLCVVVAYALPLAWLAPGGELQVVEGLAPSVPPAPRGFVSAAALLSRDALELIRQDAELLDDVIEQTDDKATKRWLGDVQKVLRDVERGRVDKRTALERLAELERSRPGAKGDDSESAQAGAKDNNAESAKDGGSGKSGAPKSAEAQAEQERQIDRAVSKRVATALDEALDKAPKGAMRDALKKAAEKKDLGLMGKLLEKLAEKAQKDMSDKELSKWMKVAEKFADKLGDKKIPKKFDKLAERVRRLQAKRKRQGGLGQADRRRLSSARRQLQQLRREHGDVQSAKYQLKRLEKNARKAAQEMRRSRQEASRLKRKRGKRAERERRRQQARRKMQQSLSRQTRRAAQEMRRQGRQQRSRQAKRIGQRRLRDLRDTLRRSGRRDMARRDFERRARGRKGQRPQQDQAMRRRTPNKPGQDQSRKAAEERAKRRAAQQRRAGQQQRGEPGGRQRKRRPFRLGQGDMPDRTRMRMMRQRGQGQQPGGQQAGQGAGGPNKGKQGKRIAAARTEKVKGAHGEGPSIKKVFTEAAKRGFARKGWRDVYAEYSEVAEEMLESEGLPVGRKALVKKYFELIRPK